MSSKADLSERVHVVGMERPSLVPRPSLRFDVSLIYTYTM